MIKRHSIATVCCVMLIGLAGLCGCGSSSDTKKDTVGITKEATSNVDALGEPTDHLQLAYAKNFSIDYYEGGYKLLTIKDGTQILTVPEGKKAPDNLDESIIVMQQPVNNIYLVSSAVMDMFRELNALDTICFFAQKAENWYVEGAKAAMENGDILYAGKYSSPDYELLVSKKCSLAIENSMILHSPEVKEMLEDFDIPLKLRHTVTEIHGKERLTGVTLAQVDEKGTPIKGTEEEISCDTLLLAVGLIPENELSREAGIQIDPKTKGPVVNEMLETSLEGVFACGNVLHVHDLVDHVSEEAALAGIYAAEYVRSGQVFRESHNPGQQEV